MKPAKSLLLGATLLLAGLSVGCIGPVVRGNFDRTLTVSGPARLYLTNGSGSARIHAGPPGQIHIHGEFRVRGWLWGNPRRSAAELSQNPPIRQEGSLVHVGVSRFAAGDLNIDYTIEVPADTEVRATTGSGNLSIAGVGGPVTTTIGSGNADLREIQGDVRTTAGSGEVRIEAVQGSAEVTAGSGDIEMKSIGGRARVTAGSGDITLTSPGNAVTLRNGSGDIRVTGATSDLRIRTGSGTVTVAGSPSTGAYWELHAGSGDIRLAVPADASFRFNAESRMGDIQSHLPMTILEQSKRELRAVIGRGAARVEVQTGSGDIRLSSSQP
jgi:hypothetical protein